MSHLKTSGKEYKLDPLSRTKEKRVAEHHMIEFDQTSTTRVGWLMQRTMIDGYSRL